MDECSTLILIVMTTTTITITTLKTTTMKTMTNGKPPDPQIRSEQACGGGLLTHTWWYLSHVFWSLRYERKSGMSKKNSLIRYSLYSSANANLIFVQNFSTFNTYSDTSYGTVYEKATDFCRIKKTNTQNSHLWWFVSTRWKVGHMSFLVVVIKLWGLPTQQSWDNNLWESACPVSFVDSHLCHLCWRLW